MRDYIRSFSWVGNKHRHLDFVLPLLPHTPVYVETFAGSAAVALNRPRSRTEIINDKLTPLVTFFRVAQTKPRALAEAIRLSPNSRREWYRTKHRVEEHGNVEDMELARCFYYCYDRGHSALGTGWSRTTGVGKVRPSIATDMFDISERLRGVTLLNQDALDVVAQFDSPDTLFYLDPPYVHGTRGNTDSAYTHELDDDFHRRLAELLDGIEGMAAVSGYVSPLYEELFPAPTWKRYDDSTKKVRAGYKSVAARVESLWVNYEI